MPNRTEQTKAILALEDGTYFLGDCFGAEGARSGEVVFNTGMTGYQEVLTDPSYRGQIVTMTYTQMGNYGINPEDMESGQPWVEGFVVRENSAIYSNWRAKQSLSDYLRGHGIIGIEGIDTRMLTKHIRDVGAQIGIISTEDLDPESVVEKARQAPRLVGRDLVKEVTCQQPRRWGQNGYEEEAIPPGQLSLEISPPPRRWVGEETSGPSNSLRGYWETYRVVVVDCGVKQNILRHLYRQGCDPIAVPAITTAEEILTCQPDGVVFSNGPGDPEEVDYVIDTARNLFGKVPVFGICLGQQIIALALGGQTYKLKFGHRGVNHPVKNLETDQIDITTQNHGFCVDMDSLEGTGLELTHINLNDMSAEGLRHQELPVFSVQFHPEAGPGPHDANYLFGEFVQMMHQFTTKAAG